MDHGPRQNLISDPQGIFTALCINQYCDREHACSGEQATRSGAVKSANYLSLLTSLAAIYKLRDVNTKGRLENIFFGIVSASSDNSPILAYKVWIQYSYISGPDVKNENWTRTLEMYDWFPDVDLGVLEVPEPSLFYGRAHRLRPIRIWYVYNMNA